MSRPHPQTLSPTSGPAEPTAESVSNARPKTRRAVLKSLAAATAAAAVPATVFKLVGLTRAQSTQTTPGIKTIGTSRNPAWFGFNLLEYFSTDPDWMSHFPYKNDGMFPEDDFRWMRDWGFNYARLPMDYRFWTDLNDLTTIDEKKVEPIDRTIRLGEKYGVHVTIGLHRAPGFCILDGLDAAATGIHVTPETTNFYHDARALDAFTHQWAFFAQRYKGIPCARLSFNLVNEPIYRATPDEIAALKSRLNDAPAEAVDRAIRNLGEKEYARVARVAINAIRAIDPARLIVSDGFEAGVAPVPDLIDTGVLQSPHDYYPAELTHYKTEWATGVKRTEPPTWPLKDAKGKVVANRKTVEDFVRPWRAIVQQGVPIHFSETGCNKRVPHAVVMAWMNDTLDAMGELHSGWALWNFRGPSGVLDTNRVDTKFEDWYGHRLDRELLELLQKKMKVAAGA